MHAQARIAGQRCDGYMVGNLPIATDPNLVKVVISLQIFTGIPAGRAVVSRRVGIGLELGLHVRKAGCAGILGMSDGPREWCVTDLLYRLHIGLVEPPIEIQ